MTLSREIKIKRAVKKSLHKMKKKVNLSSGGEKSILYFTQCMFKYLEDLNLELVKKPDNIKDYTSLDYILFSGDDETKDA